MTTLVPSFSDGSSSFLQVTRPTIKTRMSFNFGKILSLTSEFKKSMNNLVTTLAPSFCIGSSSFLQATRKPIITWMGLKGSDLGLMSYLPSSVWKNPHKLLMGEML